MPFVDARSGAVTSAVLLRIAGGLVDDCRRDGRAVRAMSSVTDALVVQALVNAGARRRDLPIVVSRDGARLVADLVGDTPGPDEGPPGGGTSG